MKLLAILSGMVILLMVRYPGGISESVMGV